MNAQTKTGFTPASCSDTPAASRHSSAHWLMLTGAAGALLPWTPPWAALLAGTTIALSIGNPYTKLTARLSRPLLQLAVVGLGAGVNLAVVGHVGLQGLGYTVLGLSATFVAGLLLARWLKLQSRLAALISVGTGICGGSAIAAVAPAIEATPVETSTALATVFLLNGVALLIFPPLETLAGLDAHRFGLWCALAIHDTSSVTGAAMTRGTEALATATTVKLARALWIMPAVLVLGWWFGRHVEKNVNRSQRRPQLPLFIIGFVFLSALFTLMPALAPAAKAITATAHAALTLTLFLIGSGLDRSCVRSVGAAPFIHGLLLWLLVASLTLAAIKIGWII